MNTYHVIRIPDGAGQEYFGSASTLGAARSLVKKADSGEIVPLPQSLYDTARKAGHVMGIPAPPPLDNLSVAEWTGNDGFYAIMIERREQ